MKIIILFIIFVIGVIGWIFNIIDLAHAHAITGMVILRAIGVFVAPLGAILGWF